MQKVGKFMKKTGKIVAVVMSGALCLQSVFSSVNVFAKIDTSSISCSDSYYVSSMSEDNVTVEVQNNIVSVSKLPNSLNYSEIKLSLYEDETGMTVNECCIPVGNAIEMSLNGWADGKYYLQIFYKNMSNDRYQGYTSYWKNREGTLLEISNGTAKIGQALVYGRNYYILQDRDSSSTALQELLKEDAYVQWKNNSIDDTVKNIVAGSSNDMEKAQRIHDWICENIYYNKDLEGGMIRDKNMSAYDVLEQKSSLGRGFSRLNAAMLRAVGIPCRVVEGVYLYNSDARWTISSVNYASVNHAWNEAYISNRWVIIDTTFDTSNIVQREIYSIGTGLSNRKNFDISLEAFSQLHYIVDEDYSFVNLKNVTNTPKITESPNATATPNVSPTTKATMTPGITSTPSQTEIPEATMPVDEVEASGEPTKLPGTPLPTSTVLVSASPTVIPMSTADATKQPATTVTPKVVVTVKPTSTVEATMSPNLQGTAIPEVQNTKLPMNTEGPVRGEDTPATQLPMDTGEPMVTEQVNVTSSPTPSATDIADSGNTVSQVTKKDKVSLVFGKNSATIKKGKTLKIKFSLNGTKERVTWVSSNKKIATVDKNGVVRAKKKGKVTITAKVLGIKKRIVFRIK